jgi:hypothetical protein
MQHALTTDERLAAALLVTHFCWRELADLPGVTDDASDLDRRPDDDAKAEAVLRRAIARVPSRPRLAGLVARRFELVHAPFLAGWRRLSRATRLEAVRTARAADFTRRGLDPAALLWGVATDPEPEVRDGWPQVLRGCFPELLPHLGLD